MSCRSRVFVAVIFIFALLTECISEAPITWPDPRHLVVKVDKSKSNTVRVSWPVVDYCPQDSVKLLILNISQVGDVEYNQTEEIHDREWGDVTLDDNPADYVITATMETTLTRQPVVTRINVSTGGK